MDDTAKPRADQTPGAVFDGVAIGVLATGLARLLGPCGRAARCPSDLAHLCEDPLAPEGIRGLSVDHGGGVSAEEVA